MNNKGTLEYYDYKNMYSRLKKDYEKVINVLKLYADPNKYYDAVYCGIDETEAINILRELGELDEEA